MVDRREPAFVMEFTHRNRLLSRPRGCIDPSTPWTATKRQPPQPHTTTGDGVRLSAGRRPSRPLHIGLRVIRPRLVESNRIQSSPGFSRPWHASALTHRRRSVAPKTPVRPPAGAVPAGDRVTSSALFAAAVARPAWARVGFRGSSVGASAGRKLAVLRCQRPPVRPTPRSPVSFLSLAAGFSHDCPCPIRIVRPLPPLPDYWS